jgi:hypothetical protein
MIHPRLVLLKRAGPRFVGTHLRYVDRQGADQTVPASEHFAMLDDGLGFSLVPWRPVLKCGSARRWVAMPGDQLMWRFGR